MLSYSRCFDPSALHDRHMRADRDAVVEINDVLVEQANAAAGNGLADGFRLGGAVQPEKGVVTVAVEIKGAGAERIVGTAV